MEIEDVYKDLISSAGKDNISLPEIDNIGNKDITPKGDAGASVASTSMDGNVPTETGADKVAVSDTGESKEAKPTAPVSEDVNDVSWDKFIDVSDKPKESDVSKPAQINWSDIGKEIGLSDEVKSRDDVVKYLDDLKRAKDTAISEYFNGVPKQLVEAIQIAKQNGDYETFLNIWSYDYSKADPIELFEDEVAQLFYNQDGTFREKEYFDYLDSLSDIDKELRGRQIQKELIAIQNNQKEAFKQKLMLEKAESLRKLEKSLDHFSGVGDYKVTPEIKQKMFKELSSGSFMDELGISLDGSHNWDKLLNSYFKFKYFDAIQNFLKHRVRAEKTREDIKELTNSSVTKPSKVESPTQINKKSGIDLYLDTLIKK